MARHKQGRSQAEKRQYSAFMKSQPTPEPTADLDQEHRSSNEVAVPPKTQQGAGQKKARYDKSKAKKTVEDALLQTMDKKDEALRKELVGQITSEKKAREGGFGIAKWVFGITVSILGFLCYRFFDFNREVGELGKTLESTQNSFDRIQIDSKGIIEIQLKIADIEKRIAKIEKDNGHGDDQLLLLNQEFEKLKLLLRKSPNSQN